MVAVTVPGKGGDPLGPPPRAQHNTGAREPTGKGGDPLGPPPRAQHNTGAREPTGKGDDPREPPPRAQEPTGGSRRAAHPLLTELAEFDEGLLEAKRSAELAAHVTGCRKCAAAVAELREVTRRLASVPAPSMPAAVAARLDAVLAGEVNRRERRPPLRVASGGGSDDASGHGDWTRPTLGRFGEDLPRRSRLRRALPMLAAAVVAAVVGFGAYVVSASAGLNEPPVVAAVSSQSLGQQAAALRRNTDLDPHRFSRAWLCAREVTSGRIVGLAHSTVDGVPALLVYTRSGEATTVTVVTDCESGRPRVGQTAEVPRR